MTPPEGTLRAERPGGRRGISPGVERPEVLARIHLSSRSMTTTTCACPRCACLVSSTKAVIRNSLSYCCVACADGHPNHEPCHSDLTGGCGCSCGA